MQQSGDYFINVSTIIGWFWLKECRGFVHDFRNNRVYFAKEWFIKSWPFVRDWVNLNRPSRLKADIDEGPLRRREAEEGKLRNKTLEFTIEVPPRKTLALRARCIDWWSIPSCSILPGGSRPLFSGDGRPSSVDPAPRRFRCEFLVIHLIFKKKSIFPPTWVAIELISP